MRMTCNIPRGYLYASSRNFISAQLCDADVKCRDFDAVSLAGLLSNVQGVVDYKIRFVDDNDSKRTLIVRFINRSVAKEYGVNLSRFVASFADSHSK
jgi:hypothetical protein